MLPCTLPLQNQLKEKLDGLQVKLPMPSGEVGKEIDSCQSI